MLQAAALQLWRARVHPGHDSPWCALYKPGVHANVDQNPLSCGLLHQKIAFLFQDSGVTCDYSVTNTVHQVYVSFFLFKKPHSHRYMALTKS